MATVKNMGNAFKALFGRTGGVGYHLAALVYARGLWAPFRSLISSELARRISDDPLKTHLVIIGSSGGYSLEPEFLARFGTVTAVDIDPLAGAIFRRRAGRSVNFIRQDFFSELTRSDWDLERWLGTTEHPPLFLFSNLLGQLEYLFEGAELEEVSRGLAKAMRSSRWISYHDQLSIPGRSVREPLRAKKRLFTEEIVQHFFSGTVEVEEHEIRGWVDEAKGEYAYLPWRLTSDQTQIIEVCGS